MTFRTNPNPPVPMLAALFLALAWLGLSAAEVQAAPALPYDVTIEQPDGSTFQARAWGDEWNNGYETVDGYSIVREEGSGYWVYARAEEGRLVPAQVNGRALVAGRDAPSGLARHERGEMAAPPPEAQFQAQGLEGGPALQAQNSGTQPVLVLLAAFSNRGGLYPASQFQSSLFGAADSVRAFYQKSSFGKLNLGPAAESFGTPNDGVVGWINLSYTHPNPNPGDVSAGPRIAKDVLVAADTYVNYASFDKNGDGYISATELHIVVVVAGFEHAVSGQRPGIWAHRHNLDGEGMPALDGVRLGQSAWGGGYAMFGEIHHVSPAMVHRATIGVMAHELGHDLSWPDLYDISRLSAGVGNWSVMGAGSWNTSNAAGGMFGNSPAMPDAFLKYYQGWIAPRYGWDDDEVTLRVAEDFPDALLLGSNPNGVDWNFRLHSGVGEYWLVENRAKSGFDTGLPGCGLLIWHVDESVTPTNNANADRNHPLIELEQADGLYQMRASESNKGDAGDPYPGSSGNLGFTGSTSPSSRFYDNTPSGLGVELLSTGCGSSMTVEVSGLDLWGQIFLPAVGR